MLRGWGHGTKEGPSKRSLCLGFRHVLDSFFYMHNLVSDGRIKGTGSWEASAIVLVLPSGGLRQATSTCLGLLLPLRNVLAALESPPRLCFETGLAFLDGHPRLRQGLRTVRSERVSPSL